MKSKCNVIISEETTTAATATANATARHRPIELTEPMLLRLSKHYTDRSKLNTLVIQGLGESSTEVAAHLEGNRLVPDAAFEYFKEWYNNMEDKVEAHHTLCEALGHEDVKQKGFREALTPDEHPPHKKMRKWSNRVCFIAEQKRTFWRDARSLIKSRILLKMNQNLSKKILDSNVNTINLLSKFMSRIELCDFYQLMSHHCNWKPKGSSPSTKRKWLKTLQKKSGKGSRRRSPAELVVSCIFGKMFLFSNSHPRRSS